MHDLCFLNTLKAEQCPTHKKYTQPKSKIIKKIWPVDIPKNFGEGVTCHDALTDASSSQINSNCDTGEIFPLFSKQDFKLQWMIILFMCILILAFLLMIVGWLLIDLLVGILLRRIGYQRILMIFTSWIWIPMILKMIDFSHRLADEYWWVITQQRYYDHPDDW